MPQYKLLLNRSATPEHHPPSGTEYTVILSGDIFTDNDDNYRLNGFPEVSILTNWDLPTTYTPNPEDASWIHYSPAGFVSTIILAPQSSSSTDQQSRRRSLRSQTKEPLVRERVYITNSMTAFISYFASGILPNSRNLNIEWNVDTGRGPEWNKDDGIFTVEHGDMNVFKDTTLEQLLEDVEGMVELEETMGEEREKGESGRKRKRGVDDEDGIERKNAKTTETMDDEGVKPDDKREKERNEDPFDRLKRIVEEGMKKVAGNADNVANEGIDHEGGLKGSSTHDKGYTTRASRKSARINFAK